VVDVLVDFLVFVFFLVEVIFVVEIVFLMEVDFLVVVDFFFFDKVAAFIIVADRLAEDLLVVAATFAIDGLERHVRMTLELHTTK